jgi:hypothetical protein
MTKTKYAKAQAAKQRSLAEAKLRSERQRKLSLEVHRRLRAIDDLANAVRIPIFKDWVNTELREERAAKREAERRERLGTNPSKAAAIATAIAKGL